MRHTIRQQTYLRSALADQAERELDGISSMHVVIATVVVGVLLGVVIYQFWGAFA